MQTKLQLRKEHIFILSIMATIFLSYKLAFQSTLRAWQINKQLVSQLSQTSNLRYQPEYLQRKNSNLNKVIELYKTDTVNFKDNCISKISLIADKENVRLNEVPVQDPNFNAEKWIIQKISLRGDYFALTRTLNHIEHTRNIGIVRSVNYKTPRSQFRIDQTKDVMIEVFLLIAK